MLPVYHLRYYEELLKTTADEEIRRVLLHSIRDEGENGGTQTNLLSGEWSQLSDPVVDMLKALAGKYFDFIKEATSRGLFTSVFESNTAWVDLRKSYIEVFEEFKRKMTKWDKQIKEGKDVTLN